MSTVPSPQQPNTLAEASLALGIASLGPVFGFGLCAPVGMQQGWSSLLGTSLFVCGASSAFLGLIGALVGAAGLFGASRSRATAVVGLGLGGLCLFLAILAALGR